MQAGILCTAVLACRACLQSVYIWPYCNMHTTHASCRPLMHPMDDADILCTQTLYLHAAHAYSLCTYLHLHAAHACRYSALACRTCLQRDAMHCLSDSCDRYHALLSRILSCISFLKTALACGACLQMYPALACRACLQ